MLLGIQMSVLRKGGGARRGVLAGYGDLRFFSICCYLKPQDDPQGGECNREEDIGPLSPGTGLRGSGRGGNECQ